MHIMIHKLIPRSQTSPYTSKIFRKNFYDLFQTFRIWSQSSNLTQIDKKNFMRQSLDTIFDDSRVVILIIVDFILNIKIILKSFILCSKKSWENHKNNSNLGYLDISHSIRNNLSINFGSTLSRNQSWFEIQTNLKQLAQVFSK